MNSNTSSSDDKLGDPGQSQPAYMIMLIKCVILNEKDTGQSLAWSDNRESQAIHIGPVLQL